MQIYVLLNLKQAEPDNEDEEERQDEEGEADELQLFADEQFDPEFRVSTWEQTILGKLLWFGLSPGNLMWLQLAAFLFLTWVWHILWV